MVVAGPGRVGAALAEWLARAGAGQLTIVGRRRARAQRIARRLPRAAAASWRNWVGDLGAHGAPAMLWLAVSDDAIARVARELAAAQPEWHGRIVVHLSGARTSAELAPLRRQGAATVAVHPLMTFPSHGQVPAPRGVLFTLEGDAGARRAARGLIRQWGGEALELSPRQKAAYHLAATLAGPGAVVAFAAAEAVLRGVRLGTAKRNRIRGGLLRLLRATAANLEMGTVDAWTGPIARGDTATMKQHREQLVDPLLRRYYDAVVIAGVGLLSKSK